MQKIGSLTLVIEYDDEGTDPAEAIEAAVQLVEKARELGRVIQAVMQLDQSQFEIR